MYRKIDSNERFARRAKRVICRSESMRACENVTASMFYAPPGAGTCQDSQLLEAQAEVVSV